MIKFINFCILFVFLGCSQVISIGNKPHILNINLKKIIWIQVPGLSHEHLVQIKFKKTEAQKKISFERMLCKGSVWNHNIYKLRPTPYEGLFSQYTGALNPKQNCSDYDQNSIWQILSKENFLTGIFEYRRNFNTSFTNNTKCLNSEYSQNTNRVNNYFQKTVRWVMDPKTKEKKRSIFHFSSNFSYQTNKVYYDLSCRENVCHSNPLTNIKEVFSSFNNKNDKILFIYRNFEYHHLLSERKFNKAKESLESIEKTLEYFINFAKAEKDTLVLVTSTSSIELDFPRQGKEWKDFESNKKNPRFVKSNLTSPVYAFGARSENFCGVYNESEIFKKIISEPKESYLFNIPFL